MDWRWNISCAVYTLGQNKVASNFGNIVLPFEKIAMHASVPNMFILESYINNPYIVQFTEDKPWFSLDSRDVYHLFAKRIPKRMRFHDEWHDVFRQMVQMLKIT